MRVRAIVNPSSSHGRTGQIWPKLAATLSDALGAIEVAMSSGPLDATTKTREALRDGVDLVVAVGGDGTVNEVVNGFFAPPTSAKNVPLRPQTALALLMSGTGGDLRKTFKIGPDIEEQVARIAHGEARAIDVGRIDYTKHDGSSGARYFINIASLGLSGLVVEAVNRAWLTKRISGRFAFSWALFVTLFRYRVARVRLTVDDGAARRPSWPPTGACSRAAATIATACSSGIPSVAPATSTSAGDRSTTGRRRSIRPPTSRSSTPSARPTSARAAPRGAACITRSRASNVRRPARRR